MTTRPVLHSVSAATRDVGSCAKMASSTESEIWSETLSGWPSETDSEVNRNSLFISGNPTVARGAILAKTAAPRPSIETLPPSSRPPLAGREPRRGRFPGPIGLFLLAALPDEGPRQPRRERPRGRRRRGAPHREAE